MVLYGSHRYSEAKSAADSALKIDPKDAEVRALAAKIRDYSSRNKIGISYDYVYFDRQYSDPWQLVSIDYSRQTSFGTVIGRINYANRFRSNGVQGELEAYPHISKTFYGYVNFGYSGDEGIFPDTGRVRRCMPIFRMHLKRMGDYGIFILVPIHGSIHFPPVNITGLFGSTPGPT